MSSSLPAISMIDYPYSFTYLDNNRPTVAVTDKFNIYKVKTKNWNNELDW